MIFTGKGGDILKITTKFALAMALIALLAMAIFNIVALKESSDAVDSAAMQVICSSASARAEMVGSFVNELQNHGRNIAINKDISSYTAIMSMAPFDRPYHPDYNRLDDISTYVQNSVNSYQQSNPNVELAVILDAEGNVIAMSEGCDEYLSVITDNPDRVSLASNSGGVSEFMNIKVGGTNTAAFLVCRNIAYDENNVGTFVQLCTTTQIQKNLFDTKVISSSTGGIIDAYQNILSLSSGKASEYKKDNNFSVYTDTFSKADLSDDEIFEKTDIDRTSEFIHITGICGTNWKLVTIVGRNDIAKELNINTTSFKIATVICFVLETAIIVFFVIYFSKPILNIVNVLTKKSRGDQKARFDVDSYDEYGQIGRAFNAMFDDVFESEQRYRTIVEMTNNIVFEINFSKQTVYVSNNFNKKFSFRPKSDDIQDSFFYKLRIHKDDRERYFADLDKILGTGSNYLQGEYRFQNIYGDFAWVLIRATKFFDRDDVPTKLIGVIVDIDREKRDEMRLIQRANFDALTQVYNRESFIKALANEFELSTVRKYNSFIMFIDLDDFKHFNDDFGHACGDEVLKFTADTLKELTFERGFAGRFGGDEFVACINVPNVSPADVAGDLIKTMSKGFTSESTGEHLSINCSIGIAHFNENGKNCEELLNAADEAMYGVKKHGKSNFGFASSAKSGASAPVPKPIDSDNRK